MAPFAKTGGLGDVVGSLTTAVHGLGHEVSVFMPRYLHIDVREWELEIAVDYFEMIIGNHLEATRIFLKKLQNGIKVYFVEHPDFFMREELYGTPLGDYPDNDRRFIYFQRAVLKAIELLKLHPDIIHCHDWQTGLIPVYMKKPGNDYPLLQKARSVFTIHNLAYQGNYPPDSFPPTGLGWEYYKSDLLEFYSKFSFLKGGLVFSDMVTTVSDRYSKEIQTKEFGCGMEGVIIARKESVTGIINGIDPKDWDPETDSDLDTPFSVKNPSKKKLNKSSLQKENGFPVDENIPLLGLVARLVDQKGLDILIPLLGELAGQNVQFVLLGTGEEKYHQLLRDVAKKNKKWFGVHILFDAKMAKRIYAGADMLLFPSYYEPCGLGQIIGLRYGAIPIARAVGGLADTIREFDPETREGNGFLFEDYSSEAFMAAILRALKLFKQEKVWKGLVKNAMECDFSWTASAKKYVKLYEAVKRHPVKVEKT